MSLQLFRGGKILWYAIDTENNIMTLWTGWKTTSWTCRKGVRGLKVQRGRKFLLLRIAMVVT